MWWIGLGVVATTVRARKIISASALGFGHRARSGSGTKRRSPFLPICQVFIVSVANRLAVGLISSHSTCGVTGVESGRDQLRNCCDAPGDGGRLVPRSRDDPETASRHLSRAGQDGLVRHKEFGRKTNVRASRRWECAITAELAELPFSRAYAQRSPQRWPSWRRDCPGRICTPSSSKRAADWQRQSTNESDAPGSRGRCAALPIARRCRDRERGQGDGLDRRRGVPARGGRSPHTRRVRTGPRTTGRTHRCRGRDALRTWCVAALPIYRAPKTSASSSIGAHRSVAFSRFAAA